MRTLAALVATAALAMVLVMGPTAKAGITRQAKCAAADHSLTHWMSPTGMAWQVIRPDEAKAFGVSPCSIILSGVLVNGQRSAMIITPHLRIVAKT